ncbi:MAG: GntR family transcriptional regulator [Lachnospirales bacterium]
MKLDRQKGAIPLYMQLSNILKNLIECGEYNTGDIIPSEKQLREDFEVSRITVRQALMELSNIGYLEPMRGIGTVVTYGKLKENYHKAISLTDEMKKQGKEISTSLCLLKEISPTKKILSMLDAKAMDKVYELERVRCYKGKPFVHSITYLKNIDKSIDLEEYKQSLYNLLRDKCNVVISSTEDLLEATLSKGKIASLLEVPEGFPLFKRTRKGYDLTGKIVEYSVVLYAGDKYSYMIKL